MKKLLFTLTLMLISIGAFAQAKTIELGARLNYATEQPHLGFGAIARYNIDNHFRPEFTANFYPKSDNKVSAWDVNMNLHYLFHITNRFKVYPLGGMTIVGADYDGPGASVSSTKAGLNLGGGVQLNIAPNLHFNTETYYQFVSDIDRGVMDVSLVYVF